MTDEELVDFVTGSEVRVAESKRKIDENNKEIDEMI
mgnify:CR=1 FL=1